VKLRQRRLWRNGAAEARKQRRLANATALCESEAPHTKLWRRESSSEPCCRLLCGKLCALSPWQLIPNHAVKYQLKISDS
jgi:hypothetical protein